ncbi:MAG: hypothetical protein ACK54F_10555 [Planctomycetia bacterium]|jgi:hypothetical protein
MDLKLHRPNGSCGKSGRGFVPGELFYSALVRSTGAIERIDICAEAWGGPPEQSLAWWKSLYPAADSAGSTLAPVEVLLDVLEQLDGQPDEKALRYLLALELVRRRVLRVVDRHGTAAAIAPDTMLLACRRRDSEYHVQVVPARAAAADGVQERLAALLWSGGAA